MRLSDADRERLLEQLKNHAAQGRLSMDELERRVAVVAQAQTQAAAAPALAGLPPVPLDGPAGGHRPRRRGHAESDVPAPEWQPTPERFRDPRTGRVMRVWTDAAGARHYVPDDVA